MMVPVLPRYLGWGALYTFPFGTIATRSPTSKDFIRELVATWDGLWCRDILRVCPEKCPFDLLVMLITNNNDVM